MPSWIRTTAALVIATILGACTGTTTQPAAQLPRVGDCGAAELQDQLGQPVTGTSAADARVGGVLVRSRGDVRVIAPGQAVIQNYSEARLNLETDAVGNLVRASCG